jgi:hypothetical protein
MNAHGPRRNRPENTLLLAAAGISALCAGAFGGEFAAWSDSCRVQLNTTSAGAGVASDQSGFPVLVRLTAADFTFSEARSDGADLRFGDSSGSALAFELERFDPAGKGAEAWVLLPTVKGNSASQWFKMYWGNASAAAASSGAAVFPASGNHAGVWHLGQDGGTAAGAYKDASGAANHGTGKALTSASDVAGAVGAGTNFISALSQGVSVPHNASLHPAGSLTLEAWVKSTTQGSYKRFIGKPYSAVAAPWNEYSLESDVTGSKVSFSVTLADGQNAVVGATAMANGIWYHVAGTYDGTTEKVYLNGVLDGTLTRSGAVSDYGQAVAIGKYGLDDNSNFDGVVDEARIARTARSADWIKLSYANQKPGQKLVSYSRFAGCQAQFAVPADTAAEEGAPLALAAKAECASAYFWSAVSGPAPRILDPDTRTLQLIMPRVSRDTLLVYRFTAEIDGATRAGDVKVAVKEAIPDPVFTLPAITDWNGSAPLTLRPTVTNAAAIKASREPVLHYAWTLDGIPVDSVFGGDSLILSGPKQSGSLKVGLCLDNRGPVVACKETTLDVALPVGLYTRGIVALFGKIPGGRGALRDLKGRVGGLSRIFR